MKDRQPKYPGRVKLIPVPGQPNVYDMVRADEPIVAGMAINKANLLTDATAQKLKLTQSDPTPNDAFNAIGSELTSINTGLEKIEDSVAQKLKKSDGGLSSFERLFIGGGFLH